MLSARLRETACWLYNVDFELNTDPWHEWNEEDQMDLEDSMYCTEVLSREIMFMTRPKA